MKFKGKKFISLVLAVLMIASVMVCGMVSASADGETPNWTPASGGSGATAPVLYFDNSKTKWTQGRIRLFVVTESNIYSYKFTSISGTTLSYLAARTPFKSYENETIDFISFVEITTAANDSKTGALYTQGVHVTRSDVYDNNDNLVASPMYIDGNHYTSIYNGGVPSTASAKFFFTPSSAASETVHPSVAMYNVGTSHTDINKSQTVSTTTGGTANYSANYLTDYKTATTASNTVSANSSDSFNAAYSTTVTLTATADTENDYSFSGWYDSQDNLLSSSSTYTYTVTGTNSVTAKFEIGEPVTPPETGPFDFYSEGTSQTKTSKIFFERPGGDWANAENKVFVLLYTDDKVYSVKLDNVSNSLLNAESAASIMNNAQKVEPTLTWAQIDSIAFIELEPSNSNPATDFTNKELVSGVRKTTKVGGVTTDVYFDGITTAAIDSTTATNNGIACYTAKYSTAVSDDGNVKYHYFKPVATANGAEVNLTSADNPTNCAQSVQVCHYGGYVSVTSYIASGTSVTEQTNIPDAVFTDPLSAVNFDAANTSTVTLTPIRNNSNYTFDGWYSDSSCTTSITEGVNQTTNAYTYTVSSSKDVYVKFRYSGTGSEPTHHTQAVTVYTDNSASSAGGAVVAKSGGVTQDLPYIADNGSSVTLTAFPSAGYQFDGFYLNDVKQSDSDSTSYTYTVDGNKTFIAKFSTKAVATLTQTAAVISNTGGTATVSSSPVASGTSVTFTATPNTGYSFYGWYTTSDGSGMPMSSESTLTMKVTTANTLYAKFYSETEPATGSAEDSSVKNNKSRHTNATSLSSQAKDYYQKEAWGVSSSYKNASGEVYESFVDLQNNNSNSSGTSWDAMQNNDLFDALYDIMSETQTHGVSYAAYGNNSLAHYWLTTDTSSDNYTDNRGAYTFFYSDVDCYNHENMQREHIWPKSKASFLMKTGLGGSDLHHLRPAYGKVNNIKSNWGFADIHNADGSFKSGWKNRRIVKWPDSGENEKTSLWRADDTNGVTFCDYNTDVHGDIARILLYIYTRWKQPNLYSDIVDSEGNPDTSKLPELDPDDSKDTGERIIYDRDTLLKWMQEDPVSEWEMKRNDLTQNVQGNRNVFIDYPELAWLLFDQSVPSDMSTPSGMASSGTDIPKLVDSRNYGDKITLDFSGIAGNGLATITAYNNTVGKAVKDGDVVDRGDSITYTVIPNESTLTKISEFSSDSVKRDVESSLGITSAYSFTRQAGYYNGAPNIDYKKEKINVTLSSDVCELSMKVNSKTATGNAGGSGSGMVSARLTENNTMLENGDTVPNGTSVTLTFTPDYGSKFAGLTYVKQQTATQISGTSSYTYTTTLDCSNDSSRERKFTAYFAQTFNSNDKDPDTHIDRHIYNKGLRPDADDQWKNETDFTTNFEICGAQIKHDGDDENNKALRFIAAIDKKILAKAKSYGWVLGITRNSFTYTDSDGIEKPDYRPVNRNAYLYTKDATGVVTLPCTNTDNTSFGDYGKHDTNTNYKYITAAVNNIQDASSLSIGLDTTIIARPYVELDSKWVGDGAPSVIYGQYIDVSSGEAFCACSGSWNYINSLAG